MALCVVGDTGDGGEEFNFANFCILVRWYGEFVVEGIFEEKEKSVFVAVAIFIPSYFDPFSMGGMNGEIWLNYVIGERNVFYFDKRNMCVRKWFVYGEFFRREVMAWCELIP